jgi:hypothetical protein
MGRPNSYSGLEWHILGESNLKLYLLTFPRSGSVFFMNAVSLPGMSRTHDPKEIIDKSQVIGILREPEESIASYMTMLNYLGAPIDAKQLIESYAVVYKYYLSNSCILILNEDLKNNPKEIINKIFEPLGRFNVFNEEKSKQVPTKNYLKSSKNMPFYEQTLKEIKSINLSEIKLLYKKAKEKATIV